MDDGLWALGALVARGVVVLNDPPALLAAHDKLLTARVLARHGLAHPPTMHVADGSTILHLGPAGRREAAFRELGKGRVPVRQPGRARRRARRRERPAWYRRHGVLVQDLVPPLGYDLRVVVAAGRVVGAVVSGRSSRRVADEHRARRRAAPGRGAAARSCRTRSRGRRATGIALAGVDLLPDGEGGWVVAELNGAVEFTEEYASWGDIFAETAAILACDARDRLDRRAAVAA